MTELVSKNCEHSTVLTSPRSERAQASREQTEQTHGVCDRECDHGFRAKRENGARARSASPKPRSGDDGTAEGRPQSSAALPPREREAEPPAT